MTVHIKRITHLIAGAERNDTSTPSRHQFKHADRNKPNDEPASVSCLPSPMLCSPVLSKDSAGALEKSLSVVQPTMDHLLKIHMSSGKEIEYKSSDVPQIPAISFAGNLDKIFVAWYSETTGFMTVGGHYRNQRTGPFMLSIREWIGIRRHQQNPSTLSKSMNRPGNRKRHF